MDILKGEEIELPAAFDAHVHLRDGEMAQLVTPTVRQGGVNQVYVMVRLMLDPIHFSTGRNASLLLPPYVTITYRQCTVQS
jgi:dihydroorotase